MSVSRIDHTRLYLLLGCALLPLHFPHERQGRIICSCSRDTCRQPAKHPVGRLVRNGLKDASKDPVTVEHWFTNTAFNIGIATGAVSNIIVLDIDPRHEGDRTLAQLEVQHGPLPPTWRFLTGGGGEHVVFRHPGVPVGNSAGALGAGLDIRGDGGYIVAPPSDHISGRPYAISVDHQPEDVALADPPDWLLEKIAGKPKKNRSSNGNAANPRRIDWRSHVAAMHAEGERNQAVARLTGHLLRNRIDPHVALDLIIAWNRRHCAPPLDEDEVFATVRSIATREVERRGRPHAR